MHYPDEQLLPISALQHLIFCPRQCALIHVERLWADNQWTAEGNVLHKKTHQASGKKYSSAGELVDGIRVARSLWLVSRRFGLIGQADVVEFDDDGRATPVEYKRGRPKKDDSDRIQLCAQAICLEEQLGQTIDHGALFYGTRRRRTEVPIDASLRSKTESTIAQLRAMIDHRETPSAERMPKCAKCSLVDLCMPSALRFKSSALRYKSGVAAWIERQHELAIASEGPQSDDQDFDL